MAATDHTAATTLVVAIRGWTSTGDMLMFGGPGSEIRPAFIDALSQEAAARGQPLGFWVPRLEMNMFSMRSPESLAEEIVAGLDTELARWPGVKRIVLLGYSAGSLLARRVFALAHGADDRAELDPRRRRPWADLIDRTVLLAGITRGWAFSSASPAHVRFMAPVLLGLARGVGRLRRRKGDSPLPFILQMQRGRPFAVTTRLQYLKTIATLGEARAGATAPARPLRHDNRLPTTVFLLGAQDEFLSPADCTELGARPEFTYLDLPGSNHIQATWIEDPDAIDFKVRAADRPALARNAERRRRLVDALTLPQDALNRGGAVPAADIDDYLDPMDISEARDDRAGAGSAVQHAVIVMHGIRDHGFWTKRVAREIKSLARSTGRVVRAPSPSYGYFSMWDFVRPGGREKAAYWFMERYADVRSHFPNAQISFVGHSNGTYIAARSMQLCPAVRFRNVVFAGSVVRRDYPWSRLGGSVDAVVNYVGHNDWVVGFMPSVFERLGLRFLDVGGAGAYGFVTSPRASAAPGAGPAFHQIVYVEGNHSAAVGETHWQQIARFVLEGQVPQGSTVARPWPLRWLYRAAPAVTLTFAALAAVALAPPLLFVLGTGRWGLDLGALDLLAVALAFAVCVGLSWLVMRFLKQW